MIRREKYEQALRALNSIMTRARWLAHEGKMAEVTDLLDAAEILPKYLAQPEDATNVFRVAVQAIAEEHTCCSHIIDEFDHVGECVW